jgi:hypothetical protein
MLLWRERQQAEANDNGLDLKFPMCDYVDVTHQHKAVNGLGGDSCFTVHDLMIFGTKEPIKERMTIDQHCRIVPIPYDLLFSSASFCCTA